MPIFIYKAKSRGGRSVKGDLDAPTLEFAENILRTSQEVVAKSLGNITTTRQALAQAASQAGLREEPLEK